MEDQKRVLFLGVPVFDSFQDPGEVQLSEVPVELENRIRKRRDMEERRIQKEFRSLRESIARKYRDEAVRAIMMDNREKVMQMYEEAVEEKTLRLMTQNLGISEKAQKVVRAMVKNPDKMMQRLEDMRSFMEKELAISQNILDTDIDMEPVVSDEDKRDRANEKREIQFLVDDYLKDSFEYEGFDYNKLWEMNQDIIPVIEKADKRILAFSKEPIISIKNFAGERAELKHPEAIRMYMESVSDMAKHRQEMKDHMTAEILLRSNEEYRVALMQLVLDNLEKTRNEKLANNPQEDALDILMINAELYEYRELMVEVAEETVLQQERVMETRRTMELLQTNYNGRITLLIAYENVRKEKIRELEIAEDKYTERTGLSLPREPVDRDELELQPIDPEKTYTEEEKKEEEGELEIKKLYLDVEVLKNELRVLSHNFYRSFVESEVDAESLVARYEHNRQEVEEDIKNEEKRLDQMEEDINELDQRIRDIIPTRNEFEDGDMAPEFEEVYERAQDEFNELTEVMEPSYEYIEAREQQFQEEIQLKTNIINAYAMISTESNISEEDLLRIVEMERELIRKIQNAGNPLVLIEELQVDVMGKAEQILTDMYNNRLLEIEEDKKRNPQQTNVSVVRDLELYMISEGEKRNRAHTFIRELDKTAVIRKVQIRKPNEITQGAEKPKNESKLTRRARELAINAKERETMNETKIIDREKLILKVQERTKKWMDRNSKIEHTYLLENRPIERVADVLDPDEYRLFKQAVIEQHEDKKKESQENKGRDQERQEPEREPIPPPEEPEEKPDNQEDPDEPPENLLANYTDARIRDVIESLGREVTFTEFFYRPKAGVDSALTAIRNTIETRGRKTVPVINKTSNLSQHRGIINQPERGILNFDAVRLASVIFDDEEETGDKKEKIIHHGIRGIREACDRVYKYMIENDDANAETQEQAFDELVQAIHELDDVVKKLFEGVSEPFHVTPGTKGSDFKLYKLLTNLDYMSFNKRNLKGETLTPYDITATMRPIYKNFIFGDQLRVRIQAYGISEEEENALDVFIDMIGSYVALMRNELAMFEHLQQKDALFINSIEAFRKLRIAETPARNPDNPQYKHMEKFNNRRELAPGMRDEFELIDAINKACPVMYMGKMEKDNIMDIGETGIVWFNGVYEVSEEYYLKAMLWIMMLIHSTDGEEGKALRERDRILLQYIYSPNFPNRHIFFDPTRRTQTAVKETNQDILMYLFPMVRMYALLKSEKVRDSNENNIVFMRPTNISISGASLREAQYRLIHTRQFFIPNLIDKVLEYNLDAQLYKLDNEEQELVPISLREERRERKEIIKEDVVKHYADELENLFVKLLLDNFGATDTTELITKMNQFIDSKKQARAVTTDHIINVNINMRISTTIEDMKRFLTEAEDITNEERLIEEPDEAQVIGNRIVGGDTAAKKYIDQERKENAVHIVIELRESVEYKSVPEFAPEFVRAITEITREIITMEPHRQAITIIESAVRSMRVYFDYIEYLKDIYKYDYITQQMRSRNNELTERQLDEYKELVGIINGYKQAEINRYAYDNSMGLLFSNTKFFETRGRYNPEKAVNIEVGAIQITRTHMFLYFGDKGPKSYTQALTDILSMMINYSYITPEYMTSAEIQKVSGARDDSKSAVTPDELVDVGSIRSAKDYWVQQTIFMDKNQWGTEESVMRELSSYDYRVFQDRYSEETCASCCLLSFLYVFLTIYPTAEVEDPVQWVVNFTKSVLHMDVTKNIQSLTEYPHTFHFQIRWLIQSLVAKPLKNNRFPVDIQYIQIEGDKINAISLGISWIHKSRTQNPRFTIAFVYYMGHIEMFDDKEHIRKFINMTRQIFQHANKSALLEYGNVTSYREFNNENLLELTISGVDDKAKVNNWRKRFRHTSTILFVYDCETDTMDTGFNVYMLCYRIVTFGLNPNHKKLVSGLIEDGRVYSIIMDGERIVEPIEIVHQFIDHIEMVENALEKSEVRIVAVAHNAARFDTILLLKGIMAKWGALVEIFGSITNIKMLAISSTNITFQDSLLMTEMGSLNNAAKALGIDDEKHQLQFDHFKSVEEFLAPENAHKRQVIHEYCEEDVNLLVKIILTFNNSMIDMISEIMRDTDNMATFEEIARIDTRTIDQRDCFLLNHSLPSTAFNIFRFLFIKKGETLTPITSKVVYHAFESAKRGGRTSVVDYGLHVTDEENNQSAGHVICDMDICSSYPNVMENETFGDQYESVVGLSRELSVSIMKSGNICPYSLYGINYFDLGAKATYGFFPVKSEKHQVIFYPRSHGKIDQSVTADQFADEPNRHTIVWYFGKELILARALFGEQPEFTIQISLVISSNRKTNPFKGVMQLIYDKREASKKSGQVAKAACEKLYMNGFYGKMGTKNYPSTTYVPIRQVNVDDSDHPNNMATRIIKASFLQEYLLDKGRVENHPNHITYNIDINHDLDVVVLESIGEMPTNQKSLMVHYAAQITAYAECNLIAGVYQCLWTGLMRPLYMDTDSIYFTIREELARDKEIQQILDSKAIRVEGRGYERVYNIQLTTSLPNQSTLGLWKFLEYGKPFRMFKAFAKKMYMALQDSSIERGDKDLYKLKGHPGKYADQLTDIFNKLLNGETVVLAQEQELFKRSKAGVITLTTIDKQYTGSFAENVKPDGSTNPFADETEFDVYRETFAGLTLNRDGSVAYVVT